MQSMTGFGHAERSTAAVQLVVDLRTVNSRYFDFKARIPRELIELEHKLKSQIQQRLPRGRVDLFVEMRPLAVESAAVNLPVVEQYLAAMEQLRKLGLQGTPSVAEMLALPGVLAAPGPGLELDDSLRDLVQEAVQEAVERAWESRRAEGEALESDLRQHLRQLARLVEQIAEGSGTVKAHYRQKFEQVLAEWNLRPVMDESRMVQEIALYIEKSDISEELARLRSHLAKADALMAGAGSAAVGRDLDFLCQEMNREVNTVLAKSVLVEVTETAVEAKAVVERLREQAQNVE